MTVGIDDIIVNDRIRKDFGDLQELADDIKENGLINPPVVTSDNPPVLIAGERRLKACKLLGWKQIEVRPMSVRDAEHQLMLEISENEVRKEFSKKERIDWARRLERIESEKAKQRQGNRNDLNNDGNICHNYDECCGRVDEYVAKTVGIGSRNTYRHEKYIVDHESELDPQDFADWDEGKLSTNKAFQMLKKKKDELETTVEKLKTQKEAAEKKAKEMEEEAVEAVKQVNGSKDAEKYQQMKDSRDKALQESRDMYEENQRLRKEKDTLIENVHKANEETNKRVRKLEDELRSALAKAENASEPVVETVEVIPDDYEELKEKAALYDERFKEVVFSNRESSLTQEEASRNSFIGRITNSLEAFLPQVRGLVIDKEMLGILTCDERKNYINTSNCIIEQLNKLIKELNVEVA